MADMKIYTIDEVCSMLNVTRRTMYNYIKDGKIQAFKMGKYWRITNESLYEFTHTNTNHDTKSI